MSSKKYFFLIQRHDSEKHEIVYSDINIDGVSFRSVGYDSQGALIEGEGILSEPCRICGDMVKARGWEKETASKIAESNTCISCNFWLDIEKTIASPKRFVINGKAYWMEPYAPARYDGFIGFGGAKFVMQRNGSDEVIVTRNLWYNGEVPTAFRERIKNNATFVKQ